MSKIVCDICFRHCQLKEGAVGFCRARMNRKGKNVCANYGRITGIAMDPIEKKPLKRFYPGTYILSVGSYGCNLACPFCQNWHISMADEKTTRYETVTAVDLAAIVLKDEANLGIAFTYNEPMISKEFIIDTAVLVKMHGKKVVLVTNGCVEEHVLKELAPWIDAMNIDLKGDAEFYQELGGSYEMAKHTIAFMHEQCHVEITSLIVPGKNDSEDWIREEAQWIASLNPDIPLHITRYFPNWKYDIPATERDTVYRLKEIAEEYLNYVYVGNV